MIKTKQYLKYNKNSIESENLLIDTVKVLSDLTQRDIDRSYNNEKIQVSGIDDNNQYSRFQRRIIA
tara:strand:+ start:1029 stop:1226 length:198 start_codon:yes stop_codon:yes gene_type:complete